MPAVVPVALFVVMNSGENAPLSPAELENIELMRPPMNVRIGSPPVS